MHGIDLDKKIKGLKKCYVCDAQFFFTYDFTISIF